MIIDLPNPRPLRLTHIYNTERKEPMNTPTDKVIGAQVSELLKRFESSSHTLADLCKAVTLLRITGTTIKEQPAKENNNHVRQ